MRKPSVTSWLLLIAGLAVFLTAGNWQYGRALQKDQGVRDFAAALADQAPPPLAAVLTEAERSGRAYTAASVQGTLRRDEILLLDNQIQGGRTGVSVFVPLVTTSGQALLVQMGWVPWPDRRHPPAIPPLPESLGTTGLIAAPPSPGLIRDSVGQGPFPRVLMSIEPDVLAPILGLPSLSPKVFWPKSDPADGFARNWQPPGIPADKHRGYALQWFSFAIAAIILFLFLHRKKKTS
ncbi:MAG: SURF1 family protein [Ahniella sp.]|nr:SURF1 family protein [Ahniella sp.]